eukprot:6185179-Pleurochrysis_carterae.AAC.2
MAAAVVGGLRQAAAGLLGVEDGAEAEQVRAAWKKKLKQAHRERASTEVLQVWSHARGYCQSERSLRCTNCGVALSVPALRSTPI